MIVTSILGAFLPVVIIIFVVVYAAKNKEQGGEKVIRYLYTYLVLFATLMMVIGGGISIFMAAADLVSPPSYMQNFSDYKQMRTTEKMENTTDVSEKELRSDYNQAIKDEKTEHKKMLKTKSLKV